MKVAAFLLIGILILVGLFIIIHPESKQNTVTQSQLKTTPTTTQVQQKKIALVIKNNELVSSQKTISIIEGQTLQLTVISDTRDELHIHGYDKEVALEANKPATLSFKADLTGRFPIELHHAEVELAFLEVQPK